MCASRDGVAGSGGDEVPLPYSIYSLTRFTPFLIYSINVTIFIEFSFIEFNISAFNFFEFRTFEFRIIEFSFFEFRIFGGSYDVVYQNCYLAAFDFAILTHIHR